VVAVTTLTAAMTGSARAHPEITELVGLELVPGALALCGDDMLPAKPKCGDATGATRMTFGFAFLTRVGRVNWGRFYWTPVLFGGGVTETRKRRNGHIIVLTEFGASLSWDVRRGTDIRIGAAIGRGVFTYGRNSLHRWEKRWGPLLSPTIRIATKTTRKVALGAGLRGLIMLTRSREDTGVAVLFFVDSSLLGSIP